jgi:osmoprotectant transport system permease protein
MDGLDSDFKAQVLTASVLCVLLAVGADLLLLGLQRWLTPWTRVASGTSRIRRRTDRSGSPDRAGGGSGDPERRTKKAAQAA